MTTVNPTFPDVLAAWERAGSQEEARAAIHPSGYYGDDAYEVSGLHQAATIAQIAYEYSPFAPSDQRVVDFGCGDGRVLMHLLQYFDRVIGADSSPTMLKRLRANVGKKVETMLTEGLDGALEAVNPTLICALACLIHHSHDDGASLIAALAHSMPSGGLLIFDLPVGEQSHERETWTSVSVWTEPMLHVAARLAGCEVLPDAEGFHVFRKL